jgi:hypothetical protein
MKAIFETERRRSSRVHAQERRREVHRGIPPQRSRLILSCLTDDVVWVLHGDKTLAGKAAFDAEIENEAFEGSPDAHVALARSGSGFATGARLGE